MMKIATKKNKILVICAFIISIATIVLFFPQKQRKFCFPYQLLFFKQCNSVNYFSLQVVMKCFSFSFLALAFSLGEAKGGAFETGAILLNLGPIQFQNISYLLTLCSQLKHIVLILLGYKTMSSSSKEGIESLLVARCKCPRTDTLLT